MLLLSWNPDELKTIPTQQIFSMDDQGQYLHLRTNQVKRMSGFITYLKHIFECYNSGLKLPDDPFLPFSPDEWAQHTPTQMMTYFIQHLPHFHEPDPVPSGPIQTYRLLNSSNRAHGIQKEY